jgi:hypothetical protein
MSFSYIDKLIELLYVAIPIAMILGAIILFENLTKKESLKNEDKK